MPSDILYLILRVLDYIVTISCGSILYCGNFNLYCDVCVFWRTCIYCVLYCLYCVSLYSFIYVYLFLFVLSVLV